VFIAGIVASLLEFININDLNYLGSLLY